MYDEEIEKAMLYYIIFQNEEYLLDEEDFSDSRNKKLIKAINNLKAKKQEVNMLSVKAELGKVQGDVLRYLSTLGEYSYGTTAETLYRKILEMSKKRKIIKLLQDSISEVEEVEDIDIFGEKIIKDINKIKSRDEKERTFVEQVVEAVETIEKNTLSKTDYSLYTGIMDLDNITCGLHNEELTIIGARPGVGKTTLALQIAENIASKGVETAIVSLEMSEYQIIQKLIAKRTRINSYKMRMGTLETNDLGEVGKAGAEVSTLPIHLITNAKTLQHIENIARKLKNKSKLGLMIIDYIQLIKNQGRFNSREQEVADITRTLKLLSLELKIPIVGLCQLNRNATKSEPMLADLRESGAIEQDADNVIFLYQEKEQEGNIVDVTLKVAKQRAGEIGKVYLKFNKGNSEFKGVIRC